MVLLLLITNLPKCSYWLIWGNNSMYWNRRQNTGKFSAIPILNVYSSICLLPYKNDLFLIPLWKWWNWHNLGEIKNYGILLSWTCYYLKSTKPTSVALKLWWVPASPAELSDQTMALALFLHLGLWVLH